jgi:hypothetical protein
MQDPFEHVDVCGDGLSVEEIVSFEGDAGPKILREFCFENRGDFGKVLDDDFKVGEFAG